MHNYTPDQLDWLRRHRPGVTIDEVTMAFNACYNLKLTPSKIHSTCKRHGIKSGNCGRFKPGHVTWNKGFSVHLSPATQFKPGHKPKNQLPAGTERLSSSGYWEVKVAEPRKWRAKHVIIWERHNGPLPKAAVVIFADGDRSNFDRANLICLSRAELVRLNKLRYSSLPASVRPSAITLAKLTQATFDLARNASQN